MTIPAGYAWSANIEKPPYPLLLHKISANKQLPPGKYDVTTVPFGDNLVCPAIGAYTTVTLTKAGCVTVMPRFPVGEPSAGFLILMRGPYTAGAAESERGGWNVNMLPGGMIRGRVPMPVYGYAGARYDRYLRNGYRWEGDGYFPLPQMGVTPPLGPRRVSTSAKVPITSCVTPPDVTVVSSISATQIWVAYSIVDMLGRETPISEPLLVNMGSWSAYGAYMIVRRQWPAPHGSSGFRIYAGHSADDLHRQPVLNYQGSPDKWTWPLWLHAFPLHDIRTDTPAPSPSKTVSSLLSPPQQDVAANKKIINQAHSEYDLFCPFILHYDSTHITNNIEREFTGSATYRHRATWDGQPLETDIPMLVLSNFGDRPKCMTFISDTALAGVAASDWAGGGAMSNVLERCKFILTSNESYGFLVDECSSVYPGAHTASEITFEGCWFSATNPVKLEGNQTGKIRFTENCAFAGQAGFTRYPSDTVGMIYAASPSVTVFDGVLGVNGIYRSLISICGYQDQANVIARNIFVDGGCPVVVSFAGWAGGSVSITDGESINGMLNGQDWTRLVEAPVALSSRVEIGDVKMPPYYGSVSFMLNQLCIESNVPVGEVVAPTEASWLASGMALEYADPGNPAYMDFRKTRPVRYLHGYGSNSAIPSKTPSEVA